MTTPLPPQEGTPLAVLNEGFRLLQRRLQEHGGQLLDTPENTAILAAHLKANDLDASKVVMTAAQVRDALWAAVCESFSRLSFQPRPEKLYMLLLQAKNQRLELKDKARRDREAAENSVPFDLQARVGKEQEKKAKEDQKIADEKATVEIARLIGDYSVNAGPNRLDHTRSEEGRAFLKKIKITSGGKYNPVITLAAVEACRWCDSVEAMQRAYDKFISDYNNAAQNNRERQRQLERSGYVGARGGQL